jgi:hypothetical protein
MFLAFSLPLTGCDDPASGEIPRAEYDRSGRLRHLAFDANGDGHNDAVATLDGAHLEMIAVDLDADEKPDRWDLYRDQQLDRVGYSRAHDGAMDSVEPVDATSPRAATAQQVRNQFVAAAARIDARAVVAVQPPGGPSR